ncbi:MAG: FMN-binding protein [Acholeplasmatales bacterium]
MRKENKLLTIFAVTFTLIGVLFLIFFNGYEKKKEVKVYKEYIESATSIKHESLENGLLSRKTTIYKGKEIVGYAYLGSDKVEGIPLTTGPKELRIEVVINTNKEIVGVRIDYSEHTADYMKYINQYFDKLPNTKLVDYKLVDEVAGASAKSMPIVRAILDQVTILVTGQEPNPKELPDPYKDIFEAKETVEVDSTFTATEKVTKKEIIKDVNGNLLGYVYTLHGTSTTPLHDYDEGSSNFIKLLVGVTADKKIVKVVVLETNHTTDYLNKHNVYFDSLKGVSVSDAPVDNVSGATVSRGIIRELIDALKAVFE